MCVCKHLVLNSNISKWKAIIKELIRTEAKKEQAIEVVYSILYVEYNSSSLRTQTATEVNVKCLTPMNT